MFGQFFKAVLGSNLFLPLILIAFSLIIFYLWKLSKHWENRSVPYAPPNIITDFKNMIFPRKNFGIMIEDLYKRFPNERLVGHYMFFSPALTICDPDLIGRMLINDFGNFHDRFTKADIMSDLDYHLFSLNGDQWKSIRAKLSPTFSSGKLKLMLSLMEQCNQVLDDQIR